MTTSRPTMPAQMPAESWLPASDGPIVSFFGSFSKATGSAPNFRLVASSRASASLKLPVMLARPSVITASMVGAEITVPSRTIANCCWVPTSAWDTWPKALVPWSFSASWTSQSMDCWFWPALAFLSSVPSTTGTERRYFTPSLSQVTIGCFGSSLGAWASGQVALLYAATHAGVGFFDHLSASSTDVPAGWSPSGAVDASGVALGEALGEALGDVVAAAFGLATLSAPGLSRPCGAARFGVVTPGRLPLPGAVAAHGPGFWVLHATRRKRSCACRWTT